MADEPWNDPENPMKPKPGAHPMLKPQKIDPQELSMADASSPPITPDRLTEAKETLAVLKEIVGQIDLLNRAAISGKIMNPPGPIPQEPCEGIGTLKESPDPAFPPPDHQYVDKTGTDEKPNPLRDAYQEFPYAMLAVAAVTAYGAKKHAPRGWRTFNHDYALGYHQSKIGRHLLKLETEGDINPEDGDNLHMAAVAWNALAYLDHYIWKAIEEAQGGAPATPWLENILGPNSSELK